MIVIPEPIQFAWDEANKDKNFMKHHVTNEEAEEIFADPNKKIFTDRLHSLNEVRFRIIGRTKKARLLFIVFTIRTEHVRIISARDINKKEVFLYEKKA